VALDLVVGCIKWVPVSRVVARFAHAGSIAVQEGDVSLVLALETFALAPVPHVGRMAFGAVPVSATFFSLTVWLMALRTVSSAGFTWNMFTNSDLASFMGDTMDCSWHERPGTLLVGRGSLSRCHLAGVNTYLCSVSSLARRCLLLRYHFCSRSARGIGITFGQYR